MVADLNRDAVLTIISTVESENCDYYAMLCYARPFFGDEIRVRDECNATANFKQYVSYQESLQRALADFGCIYLSIYLSITIID